jgi:gluconate 2-dehydrogenase gamma chain
MDNQEISRRDFLIQAGAGISAAWLASHWPEIAAAQQHAHHVVTSNEPVKLEFFTPEQAAEVEAIAAQIIPTDDTPGAREAGVVYFIDRALMTFDRDNRKQYTRGLKQLRQTARRLFPPAKRFSPLAADQQITVLKEIEKTAFFELVRTHTIMGFFANPEYGGNRDFVGWKLIGFESVFVFVPPFGHYDREYAEELESKPGGSKP